MPTGPEARQPYALLVDALLFAAERHRDHRRQDREASPYINHPIALAHILCNEAGISDEITLAAALLHDTIEDTETTQEELARRFGSAVADVVLEVTDDKSLPKAERKRLQIEHAPSLSRRARLVKLADKIANLRDIDRTPPQDWSLERKRDYFDWARGVIDGLRGTHATLEQLFETAYACRP